MNILKAILLVTNSMITFVMTAFLVLAGSYSLYALWDNSQVYAAADNVQAELLKLKPEEKADNGASFEELRKINPDVCGWITLDHTNVDLPVLQGKDNLTYINTDVYGEFAMAGSLLFWTPAVTVTFQTEVFISFMVTIWRIIQMFGDLDLYKKENFFNKKHEQVLCICQEEQIHLEVLACLFCFLLQKKVFLHPEKWKTENKGTSEVCIRSCSSGSSGSFERAYGIRGFSPDPGNVNLFFGIYRRQNGSAGRNEGRRET